MLRIFRLIALAVVWPLAWLFDRVWEHATGRNLAQDAAEARAQQAQSVVAQTEREEQEARHEELVTVTQDQTTVIERLLRKTLEQTPSAPVVSLAMRRAEIAAQSRSHDVEVRSSQWTHEPEEGSPVASIAVRR